MAGGIVDWFRRLLGRPSADPFVERARTRMVLAAQLPFERIETTSENALATWERLRKAGRGWPIVVGDDESLGRLAEGWASDDRSPEVILAAAQAIEFPQGIKDLRDFELEKYRSWLAAHDPSALSDTEPNDVSIFHGEWPDVPPSPTALTIAFDHKNRPLAKVNILLIPTESSADIPSFLRWGGWNECPAPEYHVAALRAWHARYGAELVGISSSVLNLRVTHRPATREEAIRLASEQFVYCEDIVSQGTETIEVLAASLHAHDWWYFWWD